MLKPMTCSYANLEPTFRFCSLIWSNVQPMCHHSSSGIANVAHAGTHLCTIPGWVCTIRNGRGDYLFRSSDKWYYFSVGRNHQRSGCAGADTILFATCEVNIWLNSNDGKLTHPIRLCEQTSRQHSSNLFMQDNRRTRLPIHMLREQLFPLRHQTYTHHFHLNRKETECR